MHMVDKPNSLPRLKRSTTIKDIQYTFPIQPRIIMRDLMKMRLLQPIENSTQDDNIPIGKFDAYCTYHQRKVHAINFYKVFKIAILDLIAKGKYQIEGIDSK